MNDQTDGEVDGKVVPFIAVSVLGFFIGLVAALALGASPFNALLTGWAVSLVAAFAFLLDV